MTKLRGERIGIKDSIVSAISKMAEGNWGAVSVLQELFSNQNQVIDPDYMPGPLGYLLLLDSYQIYGTNIYVLFNDICDRNLGKMLAVLRATQLGYFSSDTLYDACNRQDRCGKAMIPVDEIYNRIVSEFPRFDWLRRDALERTSFGLIQDINGIRKLEE